MANDTRPTKTSDHREKKKAYSAPKVRTHGNVRDITQGTSPGGAKTDNPLSPKNKTGFGD
jgi:hypothetical protein